MKKALITSKGITSGQKKQIKRFIQDVGEEVAEIAVEKPTLIKTVRKSFSNREMNSARRCLKPQLRK